MRITRTEDCKQYSRNGVTLCITTWDFSREYGLESTYAKLFIGYASDRITREFAAEILRQFRRESKQTTKNANQ